MCLSQARQQHQSINKRRRWMCVLPPCVCATARYNGLAPGNPQGPAGSPLGNAATVKINAACVALPPPKVYMQAAAHAYAAQFISY
jgi:hypothetical protein